MEGMFEKSIGEKGKKKSWIRKKVKKRKKKGGIENYGSKNRMWEIGVKRMIESKIIVVGKKLKKKIGKIKGWKGWKKDNWSEE